MLWSAGLPPPKQIFCHGYLTVKGQKISKSLHDDQDRPERDRRRAGRRSAALLRAARVHARRRRRLHLRGAVPALRVRPRQRPRQPAEPDASRWRTSSSPARSTGCNPYQAAGRPDQEGHRERVGGVFDPPRRSIKRWTIVREGNRYIDEQKPWTLAKIAERLAGAARRPRATARDAALGGADGRARDAGRIERDPAPARTRARTKEPGPTSGAGPAARSPSRSRCSRASSPNARRR